MPHSKAELIRGYFAAYESGDRKVIEDGFADDFTFTSPYDDAIDKPTYFERCWPNNERIRQFQIERIFERGDEAFVTYRIMTKNGDDFRNTEFFVFAGDRLKHVDVYFGASYRDGKFVKQKPGT
jgi:ketosteroid isomerase-like protein